ncbi:tetratricopeptide repeat-containing serine/threonine protein kinase [Paraliomyxa miuraensis]|uniref:tetratricopeptide repeat-containing serine/threonine protein kinase n=1 Tax=Paraliomyxa miuraensis TaxID=376150 RepID=UPI0022554902|nr:tetratricopeptide repeat-containing serine/threonine protein kinase [Paraliomyxa miuraensis]MCX4246040.1 tetratricopeptide repeat protein [Paraliomyxa miuraensis]
MMGDETRQLDGSGSFGSGSFVSRDSLDHPSSITEPEDVGVRADDAMRGKQIGRFVVLGTLGRGGMGTVYEAFDRTLDRRVAVKILHHDVTALDQKRLIHEAQALAQLSHPNVVQVYEAGEIGGQSFVAMELVQGRTLRRWLAQEPRPDWRTCVEIYMHAGAGLAAAHEQGLVHCDFKPSNAIVDEKGRVRVLDFGLARPTQRVVPDSRRLAAHRRADSSTTGPATTDSVAVMGTPAYMPLEQMEGAEVDARGDQFSFCVALYEAVYGERPFEGESLAELKEARRTERILAAPRHTKAPAKLREILVRGLAADPERRWPSMHALLDQLRPLCAPRRRRRLLALGGAVALIGALVGAGLTYQARMDQRCSGARAQLDGVWDGARRQQLEEAILGTGLSYARDTWERVVTPLDEYADAWVNVHTEVCEATSVRQEQSAVVMDLRMRCLRERAVALREVVDVLLQADPTRVKQAVTLVASLPALSRCDDVEALLAKLPPPEDPADAEQVEALRDGLAQVRALRSAGAYDEALANAESIVSRADGLGHAPLQVEAMLERGLARQELAQYEEAAGDLERAYVLAAELEHAEVEAAAVRELAFVVGHDQAKHDAGLQWSKTALALARRPRSDASEQAIVLSAIGVMLLRNGELDDALAHQQRALAIFEAALGPEHPDIADLLHNMGTVLLQQGKQDQALTHLRRALAIRQQALGPRHPHVAHSLTAIGAVLIQQGEWEPALSQLEQALTIREDALGPRHPDVATSLNNIGAVLKQQGKRQQALEHFQRALDIQREVLGARHPRVAYPLNNIGEVLREQGKLDEALTYLQQALTISEEALGSEHPDIASSAANLGNLLLRQRRYDDAEHQYRRALQIQRATLPPDHPHVALSLLGLARVGLAKEEFDAARGHAEQAVSIRESGTMAPELLAEAHFVLARILWSEPGERSRSRSLAEQAHDAWSNARSDDQQTREYLAEVEQWLTEHPMAP